MTSRRSTASAPQGSRPSPARRTRAVLVSALAVMLVAGCGVRLETPPPSEPEPDSLEVARRASVTDVLDVAQLARDLLVDRSTEDPAADQLASTVDAAAVHLDLLGGVYDSGLADGPNDDGVAVAPTGSASPSAPTAPDMDVLVERLTQAYSRSRGSLTTVPDPGLARLVAAIGAAQLDQSRSLAVVAGVALPPVDLSSAPQVPAELVGVPSGSLIPLVETEDAAGYVYEVLAARLDADAERVAASARADVHRDRAAAWATAAGVSDTATDPRRTSYAIPDGLLAKPADADAVAQIEVELADAYGTLLLDVGEEDRIALADLLTDSYLAARTWGAGPLLLPGMPEHRG